MKKFYLVFIFLSSICYSQDDALIGQWTLNSILDYDVLLENPETPINIEFNGNTNSIIVDSFCGTTYQSFYSVSTSDNSIEITEANWDVVNCDNDTQGWEVAISNLLSTEPVTPKILNYIVTNNGSTSTLELSFTTNNGDTPEGVIGFFTKLNEPENPIIGEWFLSSLTINGNTYNNVYGNLPMNFTDITVFDLFLSFNGSSSCNGINGEYLIDADHITFYGAGQTLIECHTANHIYENYYMGLLNYDPNHESLFSYTIEGTGDDQVLTLLNLEGNGMVYQKVETDATLAGTWFLESVTDSGLTYNSPSNGSPSLTLNTDGSDMSGNSLMGTADCNSFSGYYSVYLGNGDEMAIYNFIPTENICNPTSDFESAFFSILGDETSNIFSFEIINNGQDLILSPISGDENRSSGTSLTFSNQLLSVEDHNGKESAITLIANPVNDLLKFQFSDTLRIQSLDYVIYSSDGKAMSSSNLNTDSIDVSNLNSGLYFIRFTTGINQAGSTHKFIKK